MEDVRLYQHQFTVLSNVAALELAIEHYVLRVVQSVVSRSPYYLVHTVILSIVYKLLLSLDVAIDIYRISRKIQFCGYASRLGAPMTINWRQQTFVLL